MNSREYPLRPKEVLLNAFLYPMLLISSSILFFSFFMSMAGIEVFAYVSTIHIILTCILFAILFYLTYQSMQQARLIIDTHGIRTSNKLLNMSLVNLDFNQNIQILRVENCSKTMLGGMAKINTKLCKDDVALIAIKGHKIRLKMQIISDGVWQINDMNELQKFIGQVGLPVKTIQAEDFIKQYMPLGDIGKGAKILAHRSMICMVIIVLLSDIDKYSTIYYGVFKHSIWIIAILVWLFIFWRIKTEGKQLFGQVFGSILFASMFSLTSLMLVLSAVPMVGSTEKKVFEYQETNKTNEEKWLTSDNPPLEIYCRKSESSNHNPQTVMLYTLFSIKRVKGEELCPDSKFMSDGMLPHE